MSGARRLLLAAFGGLFTAGAGMYGFFAYAPDPPMPALQGTWSEATVQVGERTRAYRLYQPQKLPPQAPLVLALHGSFSTPEQMRVMTGYGLDAAADAQNFLLAYPEGYERAWNDCRKTGQYPAKQENIDDVGFLTAIITQAVKTQQVDPNRVFALGFSNGGQMALRLMLQQPQAVQKIVVVGVNPPIPEENLCPPSGPTRPIMMINGTADPIVPFDGGEAVIFGLVKRGLVTSANAGAESFADRNGLSPPTTAKLPHADPDDPTSVQQRVWSRNGVAHVVQYVVEGGGHVIPQPHYRFPRMLGKTNGDLDTPEVALQFFLGD